MVSTRLPVREQPRNLPVWIAQMRSTDLPQGENFLCSLDSEGRMTYCCLGLGQLNLSTGPDSILDLAKTRKGLATRPFMEWLGIPSGLLDELSDQWREEEGADVSNASIETRREFGFDLVPDFGELESRGKGGFFNPLTNACSAAGMNDGGFAFDQIADVFAYFGVGEVLLS